MKLIKSFPPEEPIVGMIEFRGRLLIASAKRIYEVKGDSLEPLEMIEELVTYRLGIDPVHLPETPTIDKLLTKIPPLPYSDEADF